MRQRAPCLLGSWDALDRHGRIVIMGDDCPGDVVDSRRIRGLDALDVAQDLLRAKKLALGDFATHPEPSTRPVQRFQRILMSELDHIKQGRTCEDDGNLCYGYHANVG